MKKFGMRCAVVAALGLAMVVFSDNTAANNLADPTIKDVMKGVNKSGVCKSIGKGLEAKEPQWDVLLIKAKEVTPLAAAMPKNDPPKGDKADWKKLAEGYAKAAVDLEKAIGDKDVKAALAAHKVLAACGGCHPTFRPK